MAQVIVGFLFVGLSESGIMSEVISKSATIQFIASAVSYALTLFIILGTFTAIRNSAKGLPQILGIVKRPTGMLFLYVLLGYGFYFLLSTLFLLIGQLIPGFDIEQQQELGFEQLGSQLEYIMAFLALVVLAPIIEETIFRGFLFSRLRENLSFWWTTIIVSVVFGLVHMQWNVGVDVFALSLILCYLREKTGSIWAGVGVHMLKNLVAYVILFLQPDIQNALQKLLQ
ncbi:MAG: type II CAAX endopeptidase family protein [Candidatus Saccharibacteria bacterium]|nr:type II CAAX endopeptidase family protein [Candidatus Saccharibacteria bacterium]